MRVVEHGIPVKPGPILKLASYDNLHGGAQFGKSSGNKSLLQSLWPNLGGSFASRVMRLSCHHGTRTGQPASASDWPVWQDKKWEIPRHSSLGFTCHHENKV